MLLGAGNPDDALRHYQSGLAIGEALLPSRPDDPLLARDLADCHRSLGRFYERSDCAQARQWRQKELDTWTGWPRRFPSTSVDQSRRTEAILHLSRCPEAVRR
jgi:hypothetical protein